jgi:inosine-uridine nucleoside N-ribohydrolase
MLAGSRRRRGSPPWRLPLALTIALALVPGTAQASAILDTDLHADVDDAAALAMIHELDIDLLAVMISSPGRYGAPCADAINTWYGQPNVPIGTVKPNDNSLAWKDYCKAVSEEFSNDVGRTPDATRLYRRVLEREPDRSVTVISIGFLTNLRNLLETDRSLVERKVKRLVVMGGTYPSGTEWNFEQDPAAAAEVVRRWPTKVIFSGYELGLDVVTAAPARGPVNRAYELGQAEGGERSSWDQTAVLYTVRPRLFATVAGRNRVDPGTGENRWRRMRHRHRYLRAAVSSRRLERAVTRSYRR